MAKTAHEPQKAMKEALTEAKAAWVKGKKVDGVAKSEELIPVATVLALGTYQLPPADPHQLHAMGDADAGGAAIRRRVGGGELRGSATPCVIYQGMQEDVPASLPGKITTKMAWDAIKAINIGHDCVRRQSCRHCARSLRCWRWRRPSLWTPLQRA